MVDSEQIEEPWPRNWLKYPALGNGGLVMTSRLYIMLLYMLLLYYIYILHVVEIKSHIYIYACIFFVQAHRFVNTYIYIYIHICVYTCACVRYVFVMTRNGPMRSLPPWARRPRGPSPR